MNFDLLIEKTLSNLDAKNQEFFSVRAKGAKKIEASARAKGGPSLLTAQHFKAKEIPYRECIKNVENPKFIEAKADQCFSKLRSWKSMTQAEFQRVMGELEAYGECFIKLK
jgi:hypothetical protein